MGKHPENDPGFWSSYEPPKSRVAEAIMMPLDDRWANRVINAYRSDTKQEPRP